MWSEIPFNREPFIFKVLKIRIYVNTNYARLPSVNPKAEPYLSAFTEMWFNKSFEIFAQNMQYVFAYIFFNIIKTLQHIYE